MGEGQQPGHPSPTQSRHYPAAYTSVPPEIPARLLLALLDTFSSRCALVQFPRPVLSNPAPYPDASSPTGRVLRTVSWPPGGHPGACSTFWHVPRPSGASSSFLRSLNYVSGVLGTPGVTNLHLFICWCPHQCTHHSLPPYSSSFSCLLRLLGAPEQGPRAYVPCP